MIACYVRNIKVRCEEETWRGSSLGKDPVGQLSCSWIRRQAEANCSFCHQMRYWVLDLVPSPGKALPGEVDRCLIGSRGMTHVSGKPMDYKKKKKKKGRDGKWHRCWVSEVVHVTYSSFPCVFGGWRLFFFMIIFLVNFFFHDYY